MAKIEAEQLAKKQKEAEEEAERSLAAMKAKRKRVLKSQSKSVLGMLAAGARGTKERKEEEALMAEHQGALEELEKIQAEMAVSVRTPTGRFGQQAGCTSGRSAAMQRTASGVERTSKCCGMTRSEVKRRAPVG